MGKNKFNSFAKEISQNGIRETIKYVQYDGSKYVVDGHHRLKAAIRNGFDVVPVEEVSLPYAGYNTYEDLFMWE